jgi:L-threonylcarbamoyladenylate synthase
LATALPEHAAALAARFWPGPLTLILPRASLVPLEVTAGLQTVAIRIPAHPVARALLAAAAVPVAAPSANLFSRPSPTRAAHVLEDLAGRIDIVIDGGATDLGVESTVLDLTVSPPQMLRPGAITLEALQEVLPAVREGARAPSSANAPMRAPGLLPRHYSPRVPMTLYQGTTDAARAALVTGARDAIAGGHRVGVVATSGDARLLDQIPVVIADLGPDDDANRAAARLYAALRELDAAKVDIILAREAPHHDGLWHALRDRLRRAAANIVAAD